MSRKIISGLIVVIIVFAVGLIVYYVMYGDGIAEKDIMKLLITLVTTMLIFMRNLFKKNVKIPYEAYEAMYHNELRTAFDYHLQKRRKLLQAVHFYRENKYEKSVRILRKIESECEREVDKIAVKLFVAFNYEAQGINNKAEDLYEEIAESYETTDTVLVWSARFMKSELNDVKRAKRYYERAVCINRENAVAYNNLAHIYFQEGDYQKVIEYAKKAAGIDLNLYQSPALLAIVYFIKDDCENAEKYFQMAVSRGQDPVSLRADMRKYS